MTVRFISDAGVVEESAEEIPVLVKREDGFLWLDVPVWTSEIDELLAAGVGFASGGAGVLPGA